MFYLFRWPTGTCSGINGILWLLKKKKKSQYYGLKKWIWKSWWYYSWALYIMSNISMFVSLNQVYCHLVDFNGLFNISLLLKIKYPALEEFKCVENSVIYFWLSIPEKDVWAEVCISVSYSYEKPAWTNTGELY